MHPPLKISQGFVRLNLLGCNLFTSDEDRERAMVEAAGRGDEAGLREALRLNIDPNKLTGNTSALVDVAGQGNVSAMKLLLASGADIDIATSDGTTPAIAAAQENRIDVLKLLVAEGADINKANEVMFLLE